MSNIHIFPYIKHSHLIQQIYSHILQIDRQAANARSFHECVQAQGGKESLKSLSFLNDVHTETMGRRSD